jgi:HSP20 family protein
MKHYNTGDNYNSKIKNFKKEVERLFRELFESIYLEDLSASFSANISPIDIYSTRNKLIIELEVPGVKKEDTAVIVQDNILIIKWVLNPDLNHRDHENIENIGSIESIGNIENNNNIRFLCMERRFGKFEKFLLLPFSPSDKNVSAVLSNGLLKVIFNIENQSIHSKINIKIDYDCD